MNETVPRLSRLDQLYVEYEPALGAGHSNARVNYKDGRLKGTNISPYGTVQIYYTDWREIEPFLVLLLDNAVYRNNEPPTWKRDMQHLSPEALAGRNWSRMLNRVVGWALGWFDNNPLPEDKQKELWDVLGLKLPTTKEAVEHIEKEDLAKKRINDPAAERF